MNDLSLKLDTLQVGCFMKTSCLNHTLLADYLCSFLPLNSCPLLNQSKDKKKIINLISASIAVRNILAKKLDTLALKHNLELE